MVSSIVRAGGVLLGLVAVTSAAPAGEVLRVCSDPWMPFNGGDAEQPGYVIEILQAVFPARGIEVSYSAMPWEKALAACRASEIDAVPCTNAKEAQGLTLPTEPIADVQSGIFVLKNSPWKLAGWESFKGQRIGAVAGYSYWELLDKFLAANPAAVVKLNPDETCPDGINKLLAREIDLLPECPQVFFWTVKKQGLDAAQFRMAAFMPGDPTFVAFRPDAKGAAWAKLLDQGVRDLRTSGRLAPILAKYGVKDWK